MVVIAMYFPKPEQFYSAIAGLVFAYFVLCCLAYRLKLSVLVAAFLMAIGSAIGLTHEFLLARHVAPGSHDLSRKWTGTNYSDTFFEFTSYMYVGYGCLEVFAFMLSGLVFHALSVAVYQRLNRTSNIISGEDPAPAVGRSSDVQE